MFIFIIKNTNHKIEKFEVSQYMNFPRIILPQSSDTYAISILYYTKPTDTVKLSKRGINLSEKYDYIASSAPNNLGINGYGTYYINSTFYMNNPLPSPTNCISALFNNNTNSTIKLIATEPAKNENMISITYPERFQFKSIELTLKTDAKPILENNVGLFTYIDKNSYHLKTNAIFNNNKITLNLINDDIIIFDNTLFIVFRGNINVLELQNIKIFGVPLNSIISTNVSTATSISTANNEEYIAIFSDNVNSQLPNINTNSNRLIDNTQNDIKYAEKTIQDKFNLLLTINRPPWGMYSAKNVFGNNIYDIFNRECRKGIITGQYDNNTIDAKSPNIRYLSAKKNTVITFPVGSLPENYTICTMTKYTSTNINRQRILTGKFPRNWLLGHWGNYSNGIMYNDAWKSVDNSNNNSASIDWLISCAKSYATNKSYSVIFNDVNRAMDDAGGNNDKSAQLSINGWSDDEASDFGFAYLIIWDTVLSDNELLIVSQALSNYAKTGEELNVSSVVNISANYGKTRETAGLSAIDIKNISCTNENGIYWIKNPETGVAKEVYCIMDSDCEGGGWMLAMKGRNDTDVFSYNGKNGKNYWTNNEVLNENDLDYNNKGDAKYDIYNYFKVSSNLALFDPVDIYGNTNTTKYGWRWIEPNFYNGNTSLKDFFAGSKSQFDYYSSGNYNLISAKNYDGTYVKALNGTDFNNKYINNNYYSNKIWSRQSDFKAIGFNVIPLTDRHSVRWGGTFNENPGGVPNTNDVSGGIGVNAEPWNAGNCMHCCEEGPGRPSKQMGFKWFIK
jgi:hypothetical protein